jgi:hypothetical protein
VVGLRLILIAVVVGVGDHYFSPIGFLRKADTVYELRIEVGLSTKDILLLRNCNKIT